ncbi:unnamed protein product [Paramecium pentaurelia]|uniref:Uncharacterized protein n=1 Tax=Paramecium pentaurelia TaxID=43138 RepID=A0A8S1W6G2_9CILI|nr:unnamed protein product [Paramecium pentaurelia]
MGCQAMKQKKQDVQRANLEIVLKQQINDLIQQQQQITLDSQEEVFIYDNTLEKEVKVPKMRQPIFNSLVQRRKLQRFEDNVKLQNN